MEAISKTVERLDELGDREALDLGARIIALRCAQGFAALNMALLLIDALSDRVTEMSEQWRGLVLPLIEKADLDDASRAEMLERIQHLEYATVAEGQLDRLMEQLTGDLGDRLSDRLAGRLRGETDS